mgnify:CR=1 FL=1
MLIVPASIGFFGDTTAEGATGYQPAGALYFDGSGDYLSYTPALTGSKQDFSISFWIKLINPDLGSTSYILSAGDGTGNEEFAVAFLNSEILRIFSVSSGSTYQNFDYRTSHLFRDPTAWQNLVISFDHNNGTAGDRIRLWINGSEVADADFGTSTDPVDGETAYWTDSVAHNIGRTVQGSNYVPMYLADVICLDGTSVTDASSFGETNSSGVWVPKDPSELTFGTNGFWLDFSDGTKIGNNAGGNTHPVMTTAHQHMLNTDGTAEHHNIQHAATASTTVKERAIYQSFQVSTTDPIYGVQFKTGSAGAGVIGLRIETDNSGVPSGTLVASSAKKDSHTTAGTSALTGILELDTPWTPAADTSYWLKVSAVSGGHGTYGTSIGLDTSNTDKYTGGTARRDTTYQAESRIMIDPGDGLREATGGGDLYFEIYQNGTEIFTPSSIDPTNIVVDGPANSTEKEVTLYPILDPNAVGTNKCVLSNNNLTYDWDSSGYMNSCRGNLGVSSGKYYWEVKLNNNPPTAANISTSIGVAISTDGVVSSTSNSVYPGQTAGSYVYLVGGTGIGGNQGKKGNNGSYASYNDGTSTAGDIIGVAWNADTRTLWFSKNGTWIDGNGSDNSATVKGEIEGGTTSSSAYTGATAGTYYPVFTIGANDHDCTVRFYEDDWSYSPPSGFGELKSTSTGIGNYCTWNPIANGGDVTLSEGNRIMTAPNPNDNNFVYATHAMRTGKWYMEFGFIRAVDFNDSGVYLVDQAFDFGSNGPHTTSSNNQWGVSLESNSQLDLRHNGSRTSNSSFTIPNSESWDYAVDRLLMAFDADNKKVWFGMYDADSASSYWLENDGTFETSQQPSTAAPSFATTGVVSGEEFSGDGWYLAGHFNDNNNTGNKMRMYAKEHEWVGTAPTDFKALSTHNYADPTVTDPSAYFQVATWTGNGTAIGSGGQTITFGGNSDLVPDLVWTKRRNEARSHQLYNSVTGWAKANYSDLTDAVGNIPEGVTAVTSDGFTVGNNGGVNESSDTYVAWCWKAGGAPTATNDNTSGAMDDNSVFKGGVAQSSYTPSGSPSLYPQKMSIASHGGFSIVQYVGTGSNLTYPHGLDRAPSVVLNKCTSHGSLNWIMYHSGITKAYTSSLQTVTAKEAYLTLNSDSYAWDDATQWQDTDPTSTLVSLGSGGAINGSSKTMISYCFAKTTGLIGIGKYFGNNSSSNGPYVIVDDGGSGFRPAFLMVKRTDVADNWYMGDAARNTYNPLDKELYAHLTNIEATQDVFDFTSNGFKVRNNYAMLNADGGEYVYIAFAEAAFASNSRAR